MSGPAGTIYTCPMHPEIRQIGPGACPKCGMALEPVEPLAADEGPNPELVDMSRRFWVSLVLTVPVLALAMGEMAVPALATIVVMLFSYNIGNGLTAGLVLYPLLKLATGRFKDLNVGNVLLGALCLVYYVFGLPH